MVFLSLLILACCHHETKQTESPKSDAEVANELQQTWRDYYEVIQSGDVDKLISYHTEDYINMPSFGSTQKGIEEMKELYGEFLQYYEIEFVNHQQLEVFFHDDMAYEIAMIEHNLIPKNGQETDHSIQRCMSV